jgi:acetyl-CoA carboxylase, biotin carboxylase subunit
LGRACESARIATARPAWRPVTPKTTTGLLNKILIANRGEIAVRVIRACRDQGLRSIAVYSECDRTALYVRLADEAYPIGPNPAVESYLNIDRVMDVARQAGADAVHPGYGFLAENEAFAGACRERGLIFVGPSPEAIALMGSKTAARAVAARAGVPVVPGTTVPVSESASPDELVARAAEIGYPLLVKAVAGGGGKGMRAVDSPSELLAAIRTARSEAQSSFGDSAVYFERRLVRPRHVEVQLLGDNHGTILPFVERECSVQRRHQKLIEETPSLAVSQTVREEMTSAAVRIAGLVGYTNAGTIEFLLDEPTGRAYFLEMNTRLQVEHPITEMVTGVDLVAAQFAIARGERLTFDPRRLLEPSGHAIECRVYAEDPDADFLPSPGRITHLRPPAGPGVRDDSGVTAGSEIPVFYDSLVSKVTSWGGDRAVALARMARALAEYEIRGIKTTVPFFRRLFEDPDFRAGRFDTTFVERLLARRAAELPVPLSAEARTISMMAVALQALRPEEPVTALPADGWKERARFEALRDWPTT